MGNKLNVKILVCCHKQDVMATQEPYMPIHVGKALHPELDLGIQGDNTGDNISEKNGSYCELTGMYWAWKNLKDVDVIGLCHYRRYFDFHKQVPFYKDSYQYKTEDLNKLNFTIPDKIIESVKKGTVVTAKPMHLYSNLANHYCFYHISDDFRTLQTVIDETQPEYVKEAFLNVFYNSNIIMPYNMFVLNWTNFDRYCNWLFDILNRVEKLTDISHYNHVQKRIYGYMAERLFNVWLYSEKTEIESKPVIFLNDEEKCYSERNCIKTLLWNMRADLSMCLLKQCFRPRILGGKNANG